MGLAGIQSGKVPVSFFFLKLWNKFIVIVFDIYYQSLYVNSGFIAFQNN